MFADSLLDTSWAQRSRRSWMTLTSFGVQAIAIAVLLAIPLLTTVGLPLARVVSTPLSAGRMDPGPARVFEHARSGGVQVIPYDGRIRVPSSIPTGIPKGGDSTPQTGGGGDGLPQIGDIVGTPTGFPIIGSGTHPVMPVVAAPVHPLRISSMLQGSLIRRVEPLYPPLARNARIQGSVVLDAVISKEGAIENLRLISGHPLLVTAAVDAVRQWRYKPYILNDGPIEVETQITVNFVLAN